MKDEIRPFPGCPALDGYHCQTNSLAKVFHFYRSPLSEDMLLGLGAGMGFIYWKMKMGSGESVFIGGRGNNKAFFNDIGKQTGVKIRAVSTSSARKAEEALLGKLANREPVMLFGDMGSLPWFDFPEDYHFGGHTFVACGFDGEKTVLCSDMDPAASGLKKGFYHPVTLEQLGKARGSTHKPFPPKNTWLEFDFSGFHQPTRDDLYSAIQQTVDSQLNPPIKNIGVKGIRHTSKELIKWPDYYSEHELRMNLFNLYIFIEIGGTGGGCFRHMYSRFLAESAKTLKDGKLHDTSLRFIESGKKFSAAGLLFKDAEKATDLGDRVKEASRYFSEIADIEEQAYRELEEIIQQSL